MSISINLSPFLQPIWDTMVVELKHLLRRPQPRIEQLKEASADLEAKAADISNKISQAEREGQIPTNQIELWMSKVTEIKGKVAATEEDFKRWRCLSGWSWNCFPINRRVAKRMDDINELMTRDVTQVATEPPPSKVVPIVTSADSTFGMEAYKSEILRYINSKNAVEVIGIYGMGGVGKTTLLRSINNNRDVAAFDYVIWAVASKECKIERLQMNIAKRLKLDLKDECEEDRATKLFEFLNNKECLLLLDDVWDPLDLGKLGMVHVSSWKGEQQKRKVVVFTTRDEQICGDMKASRKMKIECLKPEQAWDLFQGNAGEDAIGSDAGINSIACQIAKECAGLPLALITVGKAMSTKKSWEAWNDALTQMKHSKLPKVTGKKEADPMFCAFKLSYDSLGDDDMRGCLLSCALWPEDHLINKDQLIECWMGLGLIDEEGAIHKFYNRGHSYIEILRAACLLEPGYDEEREVKVHDVIRDMALWMANDCGMKKFKWIVRAGVALNHVLVEQGWREAEQLSLMYNDIVSLPNQLSTCSKISVLMLQHNEKLKEIDGTLIQAMSSLTYLDLENTGITEIPKEIGVLSQLQHLNISKNKIRELPVELGCLIKLNYLLLRYLYKLITVAKGAISNLSSLRFLDLRGSTYKVDWWDELENLKGCQKSICIDISKEAGFQHLCSLRHVSIWRLNLEIAWNSTRLNQVLDDIIKSHSTRESIEQLKIIRAKMKVLLISEGKEKAGGLECLKYLKLDGLENFEEIMFHGVQPQIVFPNLRELRIDFCSKLKNVNWVLQLPTLSVLHISDCWNMVELFSDFGGSSSIGLRRMRLFEMSKLEWISLRPLNFPNLEEIEVKRCPRLRKLPFSKNILKVIRCEQNWWDKLKWTDESIKNLLSPLVDFGGNMLPLAVEQIPTSRSTVGIEESMRMILGHIASANSGVIGVYGLGGVGKTTILRNIKNHIDVDVFDRVIWVVASKECKMERLQMDVGKRSCVFIKEDDTERDRASKLFDKLENMDCLLLLDDLWAPLDLTKLGMARAMQGQRKQKRKVVVFTTRNKQVCSNMNAGMMIEVKGLEPKQAWELFRRNAGEDAIGSDAGIEHMAHQIAEECAGLPLALITVGKAMSTKKSLEAWNDALTLMKHFQMPKVTDMMEPGPMFSAFKLSYDSLGDDDMRGCLLSCALWPEYYSINKDQLIECWMGLSLIDEEGAIHKFYSRGHSYIETLRAACLLEPGYDEEREVKVHDVIRDMALWTANDCGMKKFKWIVRAGVASNQVLVEQGWREAKQGMKKFKWIVRAGVASNQVLVEQGWRKAERVSLMYNDIASLPNQLSTCSKISVLMLQHNLKLEEIDGTLIQAMRSLTYLDLENTGITEIPKEIGMLSQLRHLNISRNVIIELPVDLGYLVNLNYLLLRNLYCLITVAKGAISSLSSLRFLDLRGSGYEKLWDELEGLNGCQKSISIDIRTEADFQHLCSLRHVSIWQLNVEIRGNSTNLSKVLDDIMKSHNTREIMERLKIKDADMKILLISEAGRFECLKYLELYDLKLLEEIMFHGVQPQIVFPNLRELIIVDCKELRNVNWVLQLPSLSVLDISRCKAIKELISDEGNSRFSSLTKMTLLSMKNLRRISSRPLLFPNLEEINVDYCENLRKLSFENRISVNRLKVIRCERTWWDDLEWEDATIKDELGPLVRRVST